MSPRVSPSLGTTAGRSVAPRLAPYSFAVELAALGIAGDQEATYRLLVTGGPATAAEIRDRDVLPADRVDAVLADLLELGLATKEDGVYRASPPELALRALLFQRRSEFNRAEQALSELTELFRIPDAGSVRNLVEVVTGSHGVRQRFMQLQHSASDNVRAFVRADPVVVQASENTAEQSAIERGVSYRAVIERSVLEGRGALAAAEAGAAAGEEIRTVDSLPLRMLIVDDSMALVPLAATGEPGAVVVRRSGLLDALIALFEQAWAHAVPLVSVRPEGEAELDARIIALLLQGYGDQSVSAQLGVSARTVQRRIRAWMDQAGVSTRIQLGHWLGRQGYSETSGDADA